MTGILLAGALVGLGVTLLVAGVRPPAPDLAHLRAFFRASAGLLKQFGSGSRIL